MPTSPSAAAETPAARPYGLVGLVVSTLAIAAIAALVLAAAGVLALALGPAGNGQPGTARLLANLAAATAASGETALRLNVLLGIGLEGAVTLAVLAVARFRGGTRWTDLVGWNDWDAKRWLRLFAALLAAMLITSVVASGLIEQSHPEAKDWVKAPSGTPWIVAFLALATLTAPVAEELLFRGWIFTSLRGSFGVTTAIVGSATLFALAHWESTHLYALAIFPAGVALAFIRQRADSLAASITLHSLYNGVAAVLLFAGH